MTFNRKIFSNPNPHPREIEFNPKPKQHEPIILEIGNNISRTIFYRNLKNGGGETRGMGRMGIFQYLLAAYYKKATRKNGCYNAFLSIVHSSLIVNPPFQNKCWKNGCYNATWLSWQSYKTRVGGRIQGGESSAAISEYKVAWLRREAWLCFYLIGLIETRRMSVKCISTGCHAELLNSSDLLIYSTFAQLWKLLHVIYIFNTLQRSIFLAKYYLIWFDFMD